jgi:hypothetical protein
MSNEPTANARQPTSARLSGGNSGRTTVATSFQQILQEHVVFAIEGKDPAATTTSLTEVALKSVRRSTRSKRIAAMSDDELRELLTTFVERTLKRLDGNHRRLGYAVDELSFAQRRA